jgi:CHAT domain-containing protein/tetratricopeptide (TPR) repeat protein
VIASALATIAHGESPANGVVVESVGAYSGGAQGGLEPGDVILSWSRPGVAPWSGVVESPFDLVTAELVGAPGASVALHGFRGDAARTWIMGWDPWDVEARPNFRGALLSAFREGEARAAAGRPAEALPLWRMAMADQPPQDRAWLALRAAQLLTKKKDWPNADAAFQEAVQEGTSAGAAVVAQVLRSWGKSFEARGSWEEAERSYRRSLAESTAPDTLTPAQAIFDMGMLCYKRDDLDCAESELGRAIAIHERKTPTSQLLLKSHNGLALVALKRGDLDRAVEEVARAREIQETIQRFVPASGGMATVLPTLGDVAKDRGELAEAGVHYQRALEMHEKVASDSADVARDLVRLGTLALEGREFVKAESYLFRARAVNEKAGSDPLVEAGILSNLGIVAHWRGDLPSSERYHRQALAILERLAPGGLEMARNLNGLGSVALDQGNLATAEDLWRRALAVIEKQAPWSRQNVTSLVNLGVVARERGDPARAESYFREAWEMTEQAGGNILDRAAVFGQLCELSRGQQDLERAEHWCRRAVAIRTRLVPGSVDSGESLATLAAILSQRNQPSDAAQMFDQAFTLLEDDIVRLGGADDVRSGLRARHASHYAAYIDLLMARRETARAFHLAERSRARTLLEMLREAQVDVRQGIDPALLDRERSLRADIAAKSNRRIRLLSAAHAAQLASLDTELADLMAQYRDVEAEIRTTASSYAALTQPQPLTAQEVQQQLLDRETVLLEYALGEERSHLWLVESDSLAGYELPGRAEIEAAARRFYDLLTVRGLPVLGESLSGRHQRLARADADLPGAARALSRMLLQPIAGRIEGKRLLIIADGILHYIPFAALPDPRSSGGRTERASSPLIAQHEIVSLPSASVLGLLRRAAKDRPPATKEIAVLADPVFDAGDARVRGVRRAPGRGTDPAATSDGDHAADAPDRLGALTRATLDTNPAFGRQLSFSRLPFTRDEAGAILATTRRASMAALDFDATRQLATSGQLAQYRVVHFATHALVDSVAPELSGLVLSLVDKQGRRQDGFLELQDVYNLSLGADLVVLSACKTALGRQVDGEGIVGLTRGFMYAGSPRVMATLWPVDDFATAKLMAHFYKALEEDHLPAAQALRKAQLALRHDPRWSAPFYWAGVTLQGEWQ